MFVIARNNHIDVQYRTTNTTAVHKAVSIAFTLLPIALSLLVFMLFHSFKVFACKGCVCNANAPSPISGSHFFNRCPNTKSFTYL
jgi:hypothetical protein